MQVPRRRSEQNVKRDTGPFLITVSGLEKLQRQLSDLQAQLPKLIAEVEYTKSHGDFSENAAYQDAKHTLRRTHSRIESLQDRIKRAVIIERGGSNIAGEVQIGSTVVVETAAKQYTFEILGSHEADPATGRISNKSPLGQLLLGRKAGDEVLLQLKNGPVRYKIISVQ